MCTTSGSKKMERAYTYGDRWNWIRRIVWTVFIWNATSNRQTQILTRLARLLKNSIQRLFWPLNFEHLNVLSGFSHSTTVLIRFCQNKKCLNPRWEGYWCFYRHLTGFISRKLIGRFQWNFTGLNYEHDLWSTQKKIFRNRFIRKNIE